MEDRIRNVMAAVFDISPDKITDDSSPHEIKDLGFDKAPEPCSGPGRGVRHSF